MHVGTEIAALKASFSGLNNLSWQVLSSTELIELRIPTTINWLSEVTLFYFLNLYYKGTNFYGKVSSGFEKETMLEWHYH